jgi:hypothetical protein
MNHFYTFCSVQKSNPTAQTNPDKAEYADAPNPNPAGESDMMFELL